MEYRFDFDDQLPDLPIAFDLDAVSQVFEEKLIGPGKPLGEAGQVHATRLQDTKYKPGMRCVTTYEMHIERPDGTKDHTIGVLEFTPDGVKPRNFMDDSKMPAMLQAIDPVVMQRHFAEALVLQRPGLAPEDVRLQAIEVVRYKPGLHCVFRYRVLLPIGQQVYYGKLFSHDVEQLMHNISALHEVSETHPDMPRIPRPVAYWPDLNMIVQPAVAAGVEFTKFAYDTAYDAELREAWMQKAGRNLAVFHQATVPGETRTIFDELNDLREYTPMMRRVKPELAKQFEDVIERISQRANDQPEPEFTAGHGAMRTDQFILQGEELAIIDLDGYCWANPARDLGNFLAYLSWKAIRQPEHGQFVERAGRNFLEGYLEIQPDVNEYWLSVYQAASLLKIAGRRFRSLTFLEWPLIIHLIDAAISTLEQELENLESGSVEDHRGTLVAHLSTSTSLTKFPATFIDREFPALWAALNADMMNNELSGIINNLACEGQHPSVRKAKLLSYKPGKRGVIRYDLDGMDCHDCTPVFGKLYPTQFYCERSYQIMKYLWEKVFRGQKDLGVPQPLGFIPQLSMLVFLPVEGQFLSQVIVNQRLDSPVATRTMELAGAWLAQLHTHDIPIEKKFNMQDELVNIREWADLIEQKYPEEGKAAQHIAKYLIERADRLNLDDTTPIHKDFHYEHILVDGGLKVFDFDEMRLGDPNFDLAHFCANFYLLAYRNHKHAAQFSKLQNHFFDAYAHQTGWALDEKFLFFYIYSCLKIAKQLCKLRGPRPWPEGEEQHAQVWLMLEQGLTTLAYARGKSTNKDHGLPLVEFSQIRRDGWTKATRISKSVTSSEAIHVSHKHLS